MNKNQTNVENTVNTKQGKLSVHASIPFIVSVAMLISLSIVGQAAKTSGKDGWGPEEGNMTWNDAVAKCKARGMRLPSKEELLSVYKSGDGKTWASYTYWTSEEHSADRAWFVRFGYGSSDDQTKDSSYGVRCR